MLSTNTPSWPPGGLTLRDREQAPCSRQPCSSCRRRGGRLRCARFVSATNGYEIVTDTRIAVTLVDLVIKELCSCARPGASELLPIDTNTRPATTPAALSYSFSFTWALDPIRTRPFALCSQGPLILFKPDHLLVHTGAFHVNTFLG